MSEYDRSWTDMAAETAAAVEAFAAADDVFMLFAGAVFALQQDTLRAYAIDIARADDGAQVAAIDAAQPTPLGDFATRVGLMIDAMRSIESANLGVLDQQHPPAGLGADRHQIGLLMARMRATAARLWLLTIQVRAGDGGGAGLRVGVAGMWARLQTVPRAALRERAISFTGTFYRNIRSVPMDYAAWPLTP
jgi:hypothetical protein